MLISSKEIIKRFFIRSVSYQERVDGLTYLGRQAQFERNYPAVAAVAEALQELGEPAGLYFEAISLSRLWQSEETGRAKKIFESLVDNAPKAIRAAALLTLANRDYRIGDTETAKRRFLQTSKLSVDTSPLTHLFSLNALSRALSDEGAKKESFQILLSTYPAAVQLGRLFPTILGDQLNNMAYELAGHGHLHTAWEYINRACALEAAINYPVWFETRAEIEQKIKKTKHRSTITVPSNYDREAKIIPLKPKETRRELNPRPVAKVLAFRPYHRTALRIRFHYKGYTDILWTLHLNSYLPLRDTVTYLVEEILLVRSQTPAAYLYIQLLSEETVLYQETVGISSSEVLDIFILCRQLQEKLDAAPLELELVKLNEEEINEETRKIIEHLAEKEPRLRLFNHLESVPHHV